MALSFKEKRALQKVVSAKLTELKEGNLSFKEKRVAQKELKDAKYKALSSDSKLTEESRQSNVLEMLKNNKDSTLKMPTQPPYIITVPDK